MSYDEIEIREGAAGFVVEAKKRKPREEGRSYCDMESFNHYFTNDLDLISWLQRELAPADG